MNGFDKQSELGMLPENDQCQMLLSQVICLRFNICNQDIS
jgi:hypothetical protein